MTIFETETETKSSIDLCSIACATLMPANEGGGEITYGLLVYLKYSGKKLNFYFNTYKERKKVFDIVKKYIKDKEAR